MYKKTGVVFFVFHAVFHAVPIPSLGLHLDPTSLRFACGLRLGSTLCHPYQCICGTMVERNCRHGLACGRQLGRWSRHSEVNNLIKRALVQAKIPATLEPTQLAVTDARRPDGLTYHSWREGKQMIWDFTCSDTLCDTYVKRSAKSAGSAAVLREKEKTDLYLDLTNYLFIPVVVETYGAWGPQGLKLIKDIGRKIRDVTGEKRSTFFLSQSISIAIQKGNAACLMGTVPNSEGLEGVFDFVDHSPDEATQDEEES